MPKIGGLKITQMSKLNTPHTGLEVMRFSIQWLYNFTEKDFDNAFKDSKLGPKYHYHKYLKNYDKHQNPTEAMLITVLSMDHWHIERLYDYLMNERYSDEIKSQRKMQLAMLEEMYKNPQNYR